MKKILIFTALAIVLHTGLHSQTYVPFPTASATWTVYNNDDSRLQVLTYMQTGADTTINGNKYKIISLQGGYNNIPFDAGLRELNKKIYCYCNGYEYLLFDFNVQVGDTVKHDSTGHTRYVILNIDSIQVDGSYRKRYKVDHYNIGNNPDYIIEGIGSINNSLIDAITPATTCACIYLDELICFNENGVVKYLNPDFSDCSSTKPRAGINETYSDAEIKVYPNPAQHTVYIKSNKAQAISIFNSSGQLIEKATLPAQSEYELNISNYSKGTYFISVTGSTKGAVQFIKE